MIPSILTKHCYLTWDTPPDPVENTGKGAVNQVLHQDFYLCVLFKSLPKNWTLNVAVKNWKCTHKKVYTLVFQKNKHLLKFTKIMKNNISEDFCQAVDPNLM